MAAFIEKYHLNSINVFIYYIIVFEFLSTNTQCSVIADEPISSKLEAKKFIEKTRRCSYSLKKLWQTDIGSFPFAATPLVVDVDGDGGLDIVAAPFGESFTVIEGETGKPLHDTSWPQHNLDKSVHSSPLQYDIDGDGILDILFMTSQGEGLFYTNLGHALSKYTFQLGPVFVQTTWPGNTTQMDHQNILKYVTFEPKPGYVQLEPHVLSTPVVHLGGQHLLIIPVSFYLDEDEQWTDSEASRSTSGFYLAAVVKVNLQLLQGSSRSDEHIVVNSASFLSWDLLELSQHPVYNLFTPTVIDLDGDFGGHLGQEVEIIAGLTSGRLHVWSLHEQPRQGFPKNMEPITGRVAVAELSPAEGLSMIVISSSSVVTRLDQSGRVKWTTTIGGQSSAGSQIVDVDLDGQLDIVVATDEGKVFALNGYNGSVMVNFPFLAGSNILGNVLVTKFNLLKGAADLVFLSDNGILHVLASDHSCVSQVTLSDFSLVDILVQNVVLMNRGMELIVATSDGSLICLGSGTESPPEELFEEEYRLLSKRLASPASPQHQHNFVFVVNKIVVMIDAWTRNRQEITGSWFDLYFTIYGSETEHNMDLRVYLGSQEVYRQNKSGLTSASIPIQTPEQPCEAQVTVSLYDKFGLVLSDTINLKFNQLILLDLQWLVLAPFIAMVIILLVNHGFPAKDLLPVTFPVKSK